MKRDIMSLAFLLCGLTLFAQEDLLSKYRIQALEYSHDLKASEKNILRKNELIKSAKADFKPKFMGGADYSYKGNPLEVEVSLPQVDNPLSLQGQHSRYGLNLNLVQPIYMGGQIKESVKMAEKETSLAGNQFDLIRANVSYEADIRYWNAVAHKEIEEVMINMNASVKELVRIVDERVTEDLVAANDLLMAEVKLNDADYQLMQAQNNSEVARMSMNSFVGVDFNQILPMDYQVKEILVIPSLIEMSSVYANRPEMRIAQDQIEIQESTKKMKDARFKPQVSLGVGGDYSSPGYDLTKNMNLNYGVYATVSVPIFEWGKRKKEKNASDYGIAIAQDMLKKTFDNVNLEVQSTYYTLQEAVKQVALTQNSLEKASRNEDMAMERYKEGLVSITEVLDAQLFHQNAQVNYVQSKLNAQIAQSNFNRVLGVNQF
ncbi:TolC family protein [Bacteroides coprosuis]|uniref:TolC family protein n=1 Tax=Bacteroides coprosuis TaxID=151276 RepID=UPI001DD02C1D|nr:TolC family protein [Bacteroides coprosuis]HJD92272.1 TolC family protein [Bacteroides coprosuis]